MMMMKFRFFTAGESHGRGLTSLVEGMVAGLQLTEKYIDRDLKRRQSGYGRGGRMKIEQDHAEILSGVRHGFTIGSPISLFIQNRDWENWQEQMSISPVRKKIAAITSPRPGHADLAGVMKYGLTDIRPVLERASARETAARVAAGAVARRFLEEFGIAIHSHTLGIGENVAVDMDAVDWKKVEASPVRCADDKAANEMMAAIDEAKTAGDTLGGLTEIVADGVPIGLGSHVQWDRKLDGRIAQAIMSIQAVKGVEIGDGFIIANKKGSESHDIILPGTKKNAYIWKRPTNRAGGIEGGISNGESIVIRAAVKPIATLASSLPSIDLAAKAKVKAHHERSDVCVVPATGVVAEAMLAMVIADAMLEKFGGDNVTETLANYRRYLDSLPYK